MAARVDVAAAGAVYEALGAEVAALAAETAARRQRTEDAYAAGCENARKDAARGAAIRRGSWHRRSPK